MFYNLAKSFAGSRSNIHLFKEKIENVIEDIKSFKPDFIIIGGFLHEISNPDEVLRLIHQICSIDTVIYSFVPNARSFHRLLALEMNVINDIHQKSQHDILFNRREVYNVSSFIDLFLANGYKILDHGTIFIKPFTNAQLEKMMECGIIDESMLKGLDQMIKYIPDMGAEIWITCKSGNYSANKKTCAN